MAKIIIEETADSCAAITAKGRAAGKKLQRKARDPDGLARLLARFVPPEIFSSPRERIYTPWVVFIGFLGQVLSRDGSCR